jgi:hypothetical protein
MVSAVRKSREAVPFVNVRRQRQWAVEALTRAGKLLGGRGRAIDLLRRVGRRDLADPHGPAKEKKAFAELDARLQALVAQLEKCKLPAAALGTDPLLSPTALAGVIASIDDAVAEIEVLRKYVPKRLRFPGPDWRAAAAKIYNETDLTWVGIAVLSRAVARGESSTGTDYPLVGEQQARSEGLALKQAASAYGRSHQK